MKTCWGYRIHICGVDLRILHYVFLFLTKKFLDKPKLKLTNCRTKYNWNTKRNTPKCIRQLFQLLRIVKRGRGHNWKYERRTPKLVSATFRDRCRTNLLASFQNWIQSGILSVFWFPAKKKNTYSWVKSLFGGDIEGYRGEEDQSISSSKL